MRAALKDGAQNQVDLGPCSVTIELGFISIRKTCVRRRQCKRVPGRKPVGEARFLIPPENPAQPSKTFAKLFQRVRVG
jgi:hypothetical protein